MKIRFAVRSAMLLSGWLFSSITLAGGQVGELTHAPTLPVAAVPVLGGLGLMALTALLGLFGLRVLNGHARPGHKWLFSACLLTALATATSGVKLISDAYADVGIMFADADGNTITLDSSNLFEPINGGACGETNAGDVQVIPVSNGTEVTQFITDISLRGFCERLEGNGGNGAHLGECSDSPPLEMAPDDSCDISLCCFI